MGGKRGLTAPPGQIGLNKHKATNLFVVIINTIKLSLKFDPQAAEMKNIQMECNQAKLKI